MAPQYSTRNIFRQMPNAMLARYFQGTGIVWRYGLRHHEGRQTGRAVYCLAGFAG